MGTVKHEIVRRVEAHATNSHLRHARWNRVGIQQEIQYRFKYLWNLVGIVTLKKEKVCYGLMF